MICPKCLEEYFFKKFEIDPHSLEHRGIFSCDCEGYVVFTERELTEFDLLSADLKSQMHHSRLMSMRITLAEERGQLRGFDSVLERHACILARYIEEVSQKFMTTV